MTTVQTVCGLELLAARAVLVETLGCVACLSLELACLMLRVVDNPSLPQVPPAVEQP